MDGVRIPSTEENTRDIDLSMISQGSLAGIELFKAITPDKDGDAIAGAVNMVTRKAPSERLLRLDLKGNYNNLMQSAKQYDVTFRYGERFFGDKLGLQLQANTERKIRSKENISYTYSYKNNSDSSYLDKFPIIRGDPTIYGNDYEISRFRVRFTDETRKRQGGQFILDFNTKDSGNVKLSSIYNETSRDIMLYERLYAVTEASDFNYQYSEFRISNFDASLQGLNHLYGFDINWLGSFAETVTKNPYGYRMAFQAIHAGPAIGGPIKSNPEKSIIPFIYDNYNEAVLDSTMSSKVENYEKESTCLLDVLSKKIMLTDILSLEFKIGGKYREKSRWKTRNDYGWNNYMHMQFAYADGTPINFAGTRFENVGGWSNPDLTYFIDYPVKSRSVMSLYKMSPLISFDAFDQWKKMTINGIFPSGPSHYGANGLAVLSNYFVAEIVRSAYLMSTVNLGQVATLILGARVEKESNKYTAKFSDQQVGGTGIVSILYGNVYDTTTIYNETIWLPHVHLAVRPSEYLTLRLEAYKALARPDFNLRIPQFAFNKVASGTNLVAGNPYLKDTKAWNYEVNAQIHSGTIGLFSVSAFYKVIKDLYHHSNNVKISWPSALSGAPAPYNTATNRRVIFNGDTTTSAEAGMCWRLDRLLTMLNLDSWKSNPTFANFINPDGSLASNVYNLSIPYNSPNLSYAWGFEFEHQMVFTFLPVKWMHNFVLTYNLSITRSQTEILVSREVIDTVGSYGGRPARWSYQPSTNYIAVLEKHESENQPEIYANVALGYDFGNKASIRLSMFYQDRYVKQYSTSKTLDEVVDEFIKWDLVVKYQMISNISLMLNINNIFNRKESTSRENMLFDWGYLPLTAELYGRTIDFGVRVEL